MPSIASKTMPTRQTGHNRCTVDFQPATILAVVKRRTHVAIVFQAPMFWTGWQETGYIHQYHCELRVWEGKVTSTLPEMPLSIENIKIELPGRVLMSFLPRRFRAGGPVAISLEVGVGNWVVTAMGSKISLRVKRKTTEVLRTFM